MVRKLAATLRECTKAHEAFAKGNASTYSAHADLSALWRLVSLLKDTHHVICMMEKVELGPPEIPGEPR
eukprot:m.19290 g.19290  ORF g.19290 m.19290 type:complete len:69 (+) comp30857_c0_seq1:245-451(+)